MIAWMQHIDEYVLWLIHEKAGHPFLDSLLPWFRNPYFWSPLYLFLLVFSIRNYGKRGVQWCLFFLITFICCDFIAASVIKPFVQRLRPCQNHDIFFTIREIVRCGSGFSFPSAHATNHTGMSVYLALTLGKIYPWLRNLAIVWVILVCYAQLYVCVHYPSDILGGMILGSGIGWLMVRYQQMRYGKLQ
jgi:undecaprenyl-diphosphatase